MGCVSCCSLPGFHLSHSYLLFSAIFSLPLKPPQLSLSLSLKNINYYNVFIFIFLEKLLTFFQFPKISFWVLLGARFLVMGNRFICMSKKETKENGSRSKRVNRSQRKLLAEDEFLHRQALSMAIHQHQLSQRFDGSMSRRINGSTSSRRTTLPESVAKQVTFFFI